MNLLCRLIFWWIKFGSLVFMKKGKNTIGMNSIIVSLFVIFLTEMAFLYKTHSDFDRENRAFLNSLANPVVYAEQQQIAQPTSLSQKNDGEKQQLEDIFSSSSLLSLRRIAIPQMIEQFKQTYQYRIQSVKNFEANVSQEGDAVNLVWQKFAKDDVPEHIFIYRSTIASSFGELIAEIEGTKDGYQDKNIEIGKAYYYSLVAQNGSYKSLPKKIAVNKISDTTPPEPPLNVKTLVDYDAGGIRITWENSQSVDFSYTNLYRSEVAGELGTLIAKKIAGTDYLDVDVKMGTDYFYTLVSTDVSGNESSTQVILTVGNLGNSNPFQPLFSDLQKAR